MAEALLARVTTLLYRVGSEEAFAANRAAWLRELGTLQKEVGVAERRISTPLIGRFLAERALGSAEKRFLRILSEVDGTSGAGLKGSSARFAGDASAYGRTVAIDAPLLSPAGVKVEGLGYVDMGKIDRTREVVVDASWLSRDAPNATFTIGRGEKNGLSTQGTTHITVEDSYVSVSQARVTIDPRGKVMVKDMGSRNGTGIAGNGKIQPGSSRSVTPDMNGEVQIYVGETHVRIRLRPPEEWHRTQQYPLQPPPTSTAGLKAVKPGAAPAVAPRSALVTAGQIEGRVAKAIGAEQKGLRVSVKTNGMTMVEVTSANTATRGSVKMTFPPEVSLDQMAKTVDYVIKKTDLFREAGASPTLNLTIRFNAQDAYDWLVRDWRMDKGVADKGIIMLVNERKSMATTYQMNTRTGINGQFTAQDLVQADGMLPTVEITLPWLPEDAARFKMIDGARKRATDAVRVGKKPDGLEYLEEMTARLSPADLQ